MEHTKTEVAMAEKVVGDVNSEQLHELSEVQLAFVGGGHGEVIFG